MDTKQGVLDILNDFNYQSCSDDLKQKLVYFSNPDHNINFISQNLRALLANHDNERI